MARADLALLDPSDPDETPDLEAVAAFLALSKTRSSLVGADVRPAQKITIDGRAGIVATQAARQKVDSLERMMDLADKMMAQQLGGGRVIEADTTQIEQAA